MLPQPPPPAAVPPPPPPPPGRSNAWLPWALGLTVVAAAAVVLVLVLTGGGDGTAASSTSTTVASTTISTGVTSTTGATTTAATTTTAETTTTTSATTTTTRDDRLYNRAELDYFEEIAGQAEYGDGGGILHKWIDDVRIQVFGDPTRRDLAVLDNVIEDINGLIAPRKLILVESDPNLEIHFVPEPEFAGILPEYVPLNMGYIYIWWDDLGAITDGVMLISTTGLTADERAHLIREELTQSLGLLADSTRYEDSIFYQEWTTTNRYSPLDRAVIEMLYQPLLLPGITVEEALTALEAMTAG
jgi:hypothetical protein